MMQELLTALDMLPAIDMHAHLGTYAGSTELHARFLSADADAILRLAGEAHTELTVVSSLKALFPEGAGDALAGNEEVLKAVENRSGLCFWAVLDPRLPESFPQVEHLLANPQCAGIKIHPEKHKYPIREHGWAIFEFAAKHRAVVQTHSGEQRSLPLDFLPLADAFPEVTLILSHLGYSWNQDITLQVRAIQRSRHGNLYTDTSSSRSLTPNLIEWAVAEVGASKILFGTDSPLYFAAMQRSRIDHAGLKDEEKRIILRTNAERLFGLTQDSA